MAIASDHRESHEIAQNVVCSKTTLKANGGGVGEIGQGLSFLLIDQSQLSGPPTTAVPLVTTLGG